MMTDKHKISFCTVCMNRTGHLRETLPDNVRKNTSYGNVEFVVLDYNSSDGLEDFIKKNMVEELNKGVLKYYRTESPCHFHRSHSRNVAFRLASGDLICNIDADNFCGYNLADSINEAFCSEPNIFLSPIGAKNASKDVLGRICLRREDFYQVRGYDERMSLYGFEDNDLVNRLELMGLKRRAYPNRSSEFRAIRHSDRDRLANEWVMPGLEKILLRYLTPTRSYILFLMRDGSFRGGTLIDHENADTGGYEFSIAEVQWQEGQWRELNGEIEISGEILSLSTYYSLTDPSLICEAVMFLSQLTNRMIMEHNLAIPGQIINHEGFGRDIVHFNFGEETLVIE